MTMEVVTEEDVQLQEDGTGFAERRKNIFYRTIDKIKKKPRNRKSEYSLIKVS